MVLSSIRFRSGGPRVAIAAVLLSAELATITFLKIDAPLRFASPSSTREFVQIPRTSGEIQRCGWSKSIISRFAALLLKQRRRGTLTRWGWSTYFRVNGPASPFSCAWAPRSSRCFRREVPNRIRPLVTSHTSPSGPRPMPISSRLKLRFEHAASRSSSRITLSRTRSIFLIQTDFNSRSPPMTFRRAQEPNPVHEAVQSAPPSVTSLAGTRIYPGADVAYL